MTSYLTNLCKVVDTLAKSEEYLEVARLSGWSVECCISEISAESVRIFALEVLNVGLDASESTRGDWILNSPDGNEIFRFEGQSPACSGPVIEIAMYRIDEPPSPRTRLLSF